MATFKPEPSLGLRSTGLYFLGNCYSGCWWRVEFPVSLLTLLQLESYLVPCISARRFIILKLQNTYCELFCLCIEHLPHCYSARDSYRRPIPEQGLWDHFPRALSTEMIFDQLRTIPSDRLLGDYSAELKLDKLEIIVKWLQVSVMNATDKLLRLKIQFVSSDLVPSDRAICTIGSRVNYFMSKSGKNLEAFITNTRHRTTVGRKDAL